MSQKIRTRDAWLIERANEHVAAKWTKEDILGYCDLPQKDEWMAFRRACADLGFPEPEYETPPNAS